MEQSVKEQITRKNVYMNKSKSKWHEKESNLYTLIHFCTKSNNGVVSRESERASERARDGGTEGRRDGGTEGRRDEEGERECEREGKGGVEEVGQGGG